MCRVPSGKKTHPYLSKDMNFKSRFEADLFSAKKTGVDRWKRK